MTDPAPLLYALRVLLVLGVLLGWGATAGYRLLSIRTGYVLLPVSIVLGLVSGLALLNALSYLLKPAGALPVTLAALAVSALLLVLPGKISAALKGGPLQARRRPALQGGEDPFQAQEGGGETIPALAWGLSFKESLAYLTVISGTLALFSAAALNTSWIDTQWQFAAMASIAGGNFPVMDPFSPAHYVQYHYGINLLVAASMLALDVPVWRANDPVLILLAATLLTTGYALVRRWTGSAWAAALGTAMLFWAAGLRAFDVVGMPGFVEAVVTALTVDVRDGWGQVLALALQDNHAIISGMGGPHAIVTFHHPTALALPLALGAILLYLLLLERPSLPAAALSGLALGTLALAREDMFVMTAAGLGVTWLLHLAPRPPSTAGLGTWDLGTRRGAATSPSPSPQVPGPSSRRAAVGLGLLPFVIAAVLALVQGGVITDMVFHGNPSQTKSSITGFALRWPPGFPSWWHKLVVVGAPGWEREVLKEFGLLLPLWLPAIAVLAIPLPAPRGKRGAGGRKQAMDSQSSGPRPQALVPALAVLTAIGFCAPVFVQYLDHDLELTRVFQMPLMALLTGAALGLVAQRARGWRRPVLALSGVAVAAMSSGSALLWYALFLQHPLTDGIRWEEDALLDRRGGAWVAASLPPDASVLGLSPAHSRRYAPYAGDGERSHLDVGASSPRYPKEGEAARRALREVDVPAMRALGVTHLWLDPAQLADEGRAALVREVAAGRLAAIHEEQAEVCAPYPAAPLPTEGASQTFRLTEGRSLGQSFTAVDEGLCQVEVLLSGRARPDNPDVALTLERGGGLIAGREERRAVVAGERITNDTWYAFHFAPIGDSRGQLFTLTLTSDSTRATNAVASWRHALFSPEQNLSAGRAPLLSPLEVRTEDGAPALGQLYIRPGYARPVKKVLYRVRE